MIERSEFLCIAVATITLCWVYIYLKHMRNDDKKN